MEKILPLRRSTKQPATNAYQLALDKTAMVAITDLNGKIVFVNKNFCKISKYSKKEIMGNSHDIFHSGFHPEAFFQNLWETVKSGKVWTGQIKNKAKDGSFFWVQNTVVPLLDEFQNPYQYLSFRLDITQQKVAGEQLAINRERLSILTSNFPNGSVSLIDTGLNFLHSGGTGFNDVDTDPQELVGKPIKDTLSPQTYLFIKDQLPRILNGETISHDVFTNNRYYQNTYKSVIDNSGNHYGFVMVAQDITDYKKAALSIQRSNDLIGIGEEIAKIGSWDYNFSAQEVTFSNNALKLLGKDPSLHSMSLKEIIQLTLPEDRGIVKEYMRNMITQHNPELGEFRILGTKGAPHHFQSSSKIYRDECGKVVRIIGVIKDITERKRNEVDLRDSQEMLHNIADSIPGLVMRYIERAFGRDEILYLSKGAELLWELPYKEIINNVNIVWKKIHPDDLLGFVKSFKKAKASVSIWNHEYRILMDDGRTKWISAIGNPKKLKDGSMMWNILALDVTDRKVAEELIETNLNLLTLQNTQLMDFCNIVSHNLRSPLVNMSMLIGFIEESELESERLSLIEKLKPVIESLNETFEELVESIQVKQDHELKSERILVEAYYKRVISGFEGQITKSNAIIETDFHEAPTLIYPPKYFSSILHNLISNALKYRSPERRLKILIKTSRSQNTVLLSVEDNGLGIDTIKHKDNLFKIRKVFHRHPDSKGFGLFITKTQVEARKGEIWVESKPNKGSVFYVKFKNQ